MAFIANYVQNTAATYLAAGVTAAGSMAGNAVGGVGSLIENGGRSFGEGSVQGGISSVGNVINGYGDRVIAATATQQGASSAKKVAVKPSTPSTNGGAKKALPSSTAPKQKALPAPYSGGVQKALPAPKGKTPSVASAKSALPNGKVVMSKESRPKPAGAVSMAAKPIGGGVVGTKPAGAGAAKVAPAAKTASGKVTISAASKPKAVVKK